MNKIMKNKKFNSINRSICLIIFLILVFTLNSGQYSLANAEGERIDVLIIDALAPDYQGSVIYTGTVSNRLSDLYGSGIDFSYEFLDVKKHSNNPEYLSDMYEFIKKKYESAIPDLIITSTLEVVWNGEESAFPGVPVITVWEAVNLEQLPNYYYSVPRFDDVSGNMELINDVYGSDTKINIITDVDGVDKINLEKVINNVNISNEVLIHSEMSYSELLLLAENIPDNEVIFFHRWFKDTAGKTYNPDNVFEAIYEVANAPIFVNINQRMGQGAIGGNIVSPDSIGETVSELAVKIIKGETEGVDRLLPAEYVKIFDYRELESFGLSEENLPDESFILYKEESLLELYGQYILGALLILLVQSTIIVFLVVNIRKRKELEKGLLANNKRIQELNEQLLEEDLNKDQFLLTVAEELQNPLNGISNITDDILRKSYDDPNSKKVNNLEIIKGLSTRTSMLVEDLLDSERVKRNELSIVLDEVEINSLVTKAIESYIHILADNEIEFTFRSSRDIIFVDVDSNRLIQVLYHLFDRMQEKMLKGKIGIDIQVVGTQVQISIKRNADEIRTSSKVYRFEDSIKSSLSAKIIESMAGEFKSELSNGSENISLSFEISNDSSYTTYDVKTYDYEMTKSDMSELLTRPYILVMDEGKVGKKNLSRALESGDYHINWQYNYDECYDKLMIESYDIMLIDILPGSISGFLFCERIREVYSSFQLPIIIIDNFFKTDNVLKAYHLGANDYIVKPIVQQHLLSRIDAMINLKKSAELAMANEVAFLRAQIKPHFLYNAMNTIMSFCYTDPERAGELIGELSQYLQKSFKITNHDAYVTVNNELELIRAYVNIEQARFGERLTYVENVDSNLMNKLIPPLSVQPLVENAIRHGLMKSNEGGMVKVTIEAGKEKYLRIEVLDDGCGFDQKDINNLDGNLKNGVGIRNIKKRLLTEYGNELKIDSELGIGTKVSFEIPI